MSLKQTLKCIAEAFNELSKLELVLTLGCECFPMWWFQYAVEILRKFLWN